MALKRQWSYQKAAIASYQTAATLHEAHKQGHLLQASCTVHMNSYRYIYILDEQSLQQLK
jgi:hypothetical protein